MRGMLLWTLIILFVRGEATRLPIRGEYESARREAIREGKSLLLLLDRPGGRQGAAMVRRMLGDPPLRKLLAERTVVVLITAGTKSRYPIELYYTTRFPALFLIDPLRELPRVGPVSDLERVRAALSSEGGEAWSEGSVDPEGAPR
jgi:hypothetical protein